MTANVVLLDLRRCEWCDSVLVRKRYAGQKLEAPADFYGRKFCDAACALEARRASQVSNTMCVACDAPAKTAGFCGPHYKRNLRYGDPTAGGPLRILDLDTRLWSQIDKDGPIPAHRPELGPCWVWTGQLNNKGYGLVCVEGRKRAVHIVVYEIEIGPVPKGLELDHLCRNTACCRPGAHTEPVTHAENQRRAGEALTHCRRAGHLYTPENTYRSPRGERRCRECGRDRDRQRSPRVKAAAA